RPLLPRIDHDRARHERGAVVGVGLSRRRAVGANDVTEDGWPRRHLTGDCACIRIEQQLRWIAAHTLFGAPRSEDTETVTLTRFHIRHVAMPAERRPF